MASPSVPGSEGATTVKGRRAPRGPSKSLNLDGAGDGNRTQAGGLAQAQGMAAPENQSQVFEWPLPADLDPSRTSALPPTLPRISA
jgi:hypothetical protein